MNRKLRDVLVLVAACLTLVWSIPSVGQVLKGSISGTVVDPQGAVVTGAQVKATHTATGAVQTTKSDNAGLFRFNLIPSGNYKVEITAQGFKTAIENDILVAAGGDRDLGAVKLTVGGADTTVEVTGAAPLVETTQAQVTSTFAGTTLQTFSGIQENQGLDNLALFVPGVSSVRDNSFSNTNGGAGFSSNGLRGRNNDQEIDGQNNNDNSVAGPALFVSDTEFVGQYVIVTNNFGPEYGRNAGSVVNIITKSGTNAWHGSIYAAENNSILNSMNNNQKEFTTDPVTGNAITKPPRLNNEFGGFTVGGPMVKNKSFIFGGFDQQIISTKSIDTNSSPFPTPAGLATLNGCFPGSTALAAVNAFGPYSISGGSPFPSGGTVTPLVTQPGFLASCPGVQYAGVTRILNSPTHNFNFTLKNDTSIGGSDSFTARYLFNRGNVFNNDFGDAAAGYPVNVLALSQAVLFSETHNFSARMVNEARVGFNRLNVDFGGNSLGTVPLASGVADALTKVTFSSFTGPLGLTLGSPIGAATNLPQSRIVNTWQAQDNWTYVLGKHNLKAGLNWTYQRSPNIFLPNIDGAYRFTSWGSIGANTPNRVRIASGNPNLDFREYDTFLYAGDDWKIGKNLTLNLGVTWTYYGQPENLFNQITTQRESNPATAFWAATEPLTGGFTNPGAAIPLSVRTDPNVPAVTNSFGPSIGFAYSPQWGGFLTGHGKTTFRGGYRMLYDPPFYNIFINVSTSAPEVFLNTLPNAATHPLPAVPTGPNIQSSLGASIQKGAFDPRTFAQTTVTPNFGPDKVHTWSFGFERELSKNSALEVRYAGNKGYDLFQSVNGNPFIGDLKTDFPSLVPSGLTPCTAANAFNTVAIGRANCNQGIVLTRNNGGYSYYNGLQTEFRANNLFKQLTIRAGYTWSKTMDNVSEIFSTFGGGNSLTLAQNPANSTTGEYSYSGLDYPNTFTLLFTEQLPFFKEQHGVVGHVLGGWAVSSDYIWQSGQRYTPVQVGEAFSGAAGNYYDFNFLANFAGVDLARPFVGNVKAPVTAVGMFGGDIGAGTPTQLYSLNQLNLTGNLVAVTKDQVRYIINGGEAQTIFGTPFGGARNLSADAITNIANLSIYKDIKFSEHMSFQFRMSMLNAFNHPNFQTVDVFPEDAGLQGLNPRVGGVGFGDPSVTNTTPFFYSAPGTRLIYFGGTFRF